MTHSRQQSDRGSPAPIPVYTIALLSGVAGLIYELSWSRQLGLLFGQTAQAAAVVLCSYFAGMALGYLGAGRFAHRWKHPLRGYAFAEFAVAAWALVIPVIVARLDGSPLAALINSNIPWIQVLVRAVVVIIVLLPATIGLGASLPFIVEFLARDRDDPTRRVNVVYALNTAGGAIGIVCAAVFLLLLVGVRGSAYLAASISLLCGVAAWSIDTFSASRAPSQLAPPAQAPQPRWQLLAALSGFGVLTLEVLYSHLFALVFHNSTYTFGLVLVVCLLGLSVGAALARRVANSLGSRAIPETFVMAAAFIPTSVIVFGVVTKLRYFTFGQSLSSYLFGAFGLVMLVVFPVAFVGGLLLPMIWRAASENEPASAVFGRLNAINTIAAAIGALVASFVALPLLGIWGAFGLVATIYLLASFAAGRTRLLPTAMTGAVIVLGIWAPRSARALEPTQEVVAHWNSTYGWVDVIRDAATGNLLMRRDAHHVLGTTADAQPEKWQAELPLRLHPKPSNVLFIGMGTGITAGRALDYPGVDHATVVELIPEVAKATHLFAEFNGNVLDDPRMTLLINDGRHFLAATDQRFDLIVADIFVPWESQTGYLYTVEHYRTAQSRLTPGGLYCQWLPTWQLRDDDLVTIVDSFAAVFPHVGVWYGNTGDAFVLLALVGSNDPISAKRLVGGSESEAAAMGAVLRSYAGDWIVSPSPVLNTDEHPRVEFLAPHVQYDREKQLVLRSRLLSVIGPRLSRRPDFEINPRSAN